MSFADAEAQVELDLLRHRYEAGVQLQKAYNVTFGNPVGEDVLEDLRKFCMIGFDAYTPGTFDQTAYNLGLQRVFLHIEARMRGPEMPDELRAYDNLKAEGTEDE